MLHSGRKFGRRLQLGVTKTRRFEPCCRK